MCYHRLTKSYLVLSKERKYLFCAYFCQTMKIPFKAIAALIILSLIGKDAYQRKDNQCGYGFKRYLHGLAKIGTK